MTHVVAMNTQKGNDKAQRIVAAAVRMHKEQGMTATESLQFINKSLQTLGSADGFQEAQGLFARLDCENLFRVQAAIHAQKKVDQTAA